MDQERIAAISYHVPRTVESKASFVRRVARLGGKCLGWCATRRRPCDGEGRREPPVGDGTKRIGAFWRGALVVGLTAHSNNSIRLRGVCFAEALRHRISVNFRIRLRFCFLDLDESSSVLLSKQFVGRTAYAANCQIKNEAAIERAAGNNSSVRRFAEKPVRANSIRRSPSRLRERART